ncbi:hypothetical protein [Rhodococcus sp. KBS0724]|uniref:hypothetical protein n=1 Tax=Rhodococcus sp. KBS0724 TaxID=1179674 RepID=UPI00163D7BDE|nr:hypothetical protein [Rhodococcus sp. KBS0724]
MGLSEYNVVIDGFATTLQLSDEDAKARGLVAAKAVTAPPNKARTRTRTKKV